MRELEPLLGIRRTRVPLVALAAGVLGCMVAFVVIAFTNGYDNPLDVGGRPLQSWPADVPIAFETTVLFAALSIFAVTLLRSGLPRLHAPLFGTDGFQRVSDNRYWLGVDEREQGAEVFARACAHLGAEPARLPHVEAP